LEKKHFQMMELPEDRRQEAAGPLRRLPYVAQVTLLTVVYFAAAKLALSFAIAPGYATPIWPPSGIALAALLLLGNRVWPGVWLGAALVNFTVNSSPALAFAIGTGNTLEALAGALMVRRYIVGLSCRFERASDVFKFVAVAALSCTIAATIAVGWLALEGPLSRPDALQNWITWWQGDVAGVIIVTPLILSWSIRHPIAWSQWRLIELASFVVALWGVTNLVFDQAPRAFPVSATFLILPLIIWAAYRFTQREVTTAVAAVFAIALPYTLDGEGPFGSPSLNASLLMLLAFMSTLVVTGLLLNAVEGERKRAIQDLEQELRGVKDEAITDPLTGLANRRYLWHFLPYELLRIERRQSSLAVIMIDLDHFKRVNDTHGHDAGDLVLTSVAAQLRRHIRGSDIACRYGGEEFVLVLPDASLEGTRRRAEGIREAIRRLALSYHGKPLGKITASIGIAMFPEHADDPESLMLRVDRLMYHAKKSGRDRVVINLDPQGPSGSEGASA
jgi:diguanylate cyclase (GGDEF)-like protein